MDHIRHLPLKGVSNLISNLNSAMGGRGNKWSNVYLKYIGECSSWISSIDGLGTGSIQHYQLDQTFLLQWGQFLYLFYTRCKFIKEPGAHLL